MSTTSKLVACLGLEPDQVRVHISGIGGAFGSQRGLERTDTSGNGRSSHGASCEGGPRPNRGFCGACEKRHSARMRYRHEADRDGSLVRVEATLLFDGGAYHTTTEAVIANAAYFAAGPYRCQSVRGGRSRTSHQPPSFWCNARIRLQPGHVCGGGSDGPSRGRDRDGLRWTFRRRNALGPGDRMPTTGQEITEPLPTVWR